MHAVRNITLCTKDCLCLYVCPTGATDTENGQIDPLKCISGCRVCVDACPSHAISLVPSHYPPQQEKGEKVVEGLIALAESKVRQAAMAKHMHGHSAAPVFKQFTAALAESNQLMAEDHLREAGYLLPQSENVQKLIKDLMNNNEDQDFPMAACEKLIGLLKRNSLTD